MTEAGLYDFLAASKLGVLGTVSGTGEPQSALVGIAVTEQLEIVFDTLKSSRKYPNLLAHPPCSFVIGGWQDGDERTVQYQGEARELAPSDAQRYQEVYFKAWPDGRAHLSWPGITYFVVSPAWIRYSDFNQSPPMIREFSLEKVTVAGTKRQAGSSH